MRVDFMSMPVPASQLLCQLLPLLLLLTLTLLLMLMLHKRILRQQTWLADHKLLTFGEEGEYYERAQQEKRKRYEHKTPYLERELKKVKRIDFHDVHAFGKYEARARCGRKTLPTNDLRSKQH